MAAKKQSKHDAAVKEMNKRIKAIQDARRGIPEEHIAEVRAAREKAHFALLESNPEYKKALEGANKIYDKSRSEIEKALDLIPPQRPIRPKGFGSFSGRPAPIGSRPFQDPFWPEYPECGVKDFVLPFVRASATSNFLNVSPIEEVHHGYFGWGAQESPLDFPMILNEGEGYEDPVSGVLSFFWTITVPHDGVFAMFPNRVAPSVYINYFYSVHGAADPDENASIEVDATACVFLDNENLYWENREICSDATGFITKASDGEDDLYLPERVFFQAEEGQLLTMILNLSVKTWTTHNGKAVVIINKFAMPFNDELDLLDIEVTS